MFSSHYEGPGPSLFAPKIDSGTQCAPGVLVFTLWSPLLAPKCAQRCPKGAQREPKGPKRSSKASPGTPKNYQKLDLGPHLGTPGSPGGSRGTPGKENDTKID